MEILNALGVNETTFIQGGVFLVAYIFLSQILFKPYFRAYQDRKSRTVGQTESAERYIQETKELHTQYESKAQHINSQYKSIYDQSRTQALREYDQLVNEARGKTKQLLDSQRTLIQAEIEKAKKQVAEEVSEVSAAIQTRLLGQETSA